MSNKLLSTSALIIIITGAFTTATIIKKKADVVDGENSENDEASLPLLSDRGRQSSKDYETSNNPVQ